MVILGQDGEKWACEACLKGHRVSSCTHKDRQLFHVNKKGRPVSQCQHCRGLRKARSAHVKCVCAEHGIVKDGDKAGEACGKCQCMQDKPCICSIKRETLQGDDLQKAAARNLTHRRAHSHGKPAMLNRRSDSVVPSRPQLGHHPPLHRNNNAAHESGVPYTIPKFTASTPSVDLVQRSTDSLPLVHPPKPGGLHRASLSTSNLPQSFSSVMPSHVSPNPIRPVMEQRSGSGNSLAMSADNDVATPGDGGFIHSSLSPANPTRYSMNDFSSFSFPEFGSGDGRAPGQGLWSPSGAQYGADQFYRQSNFAASTGQLPEWPEFSSAESPLTYQGYAAQSTPQRSSVVSMEHPGLTHSPSNTASDAESYLHQHDSVTPSTSRPVQIPDQPPWVMKEFVDPQALEAGSGSYNSASTDLPYRPSGADFWGDYFTTGPASVAAESAGSGVQVKQEMDDVAGLGAGSYEPSTDFDGDLTTMNFNNGWDAFNATPAFDGQ